MKITEVRLERLTVPLDPPFAAAWDPQPRRSFSATVVIVSTDDGLVGIGSGDTMDGFEPFIELFVGQDPRRIAHHVKVLETISFHAGRYWPMEAALWDILGQICQQPVAVLFGGTTDRLMAYASCGELKPPPARVESVLAMREEGFRAVKLRLDRNRLEEGLATVEAVRDAVGPEFAIMVDLNQGWRMAGDVAPLLDLPAVRRIAGSLRELGVFWVEEPLPAKDRIGLATLRAHAGLRIAGGEMCRSTSELIAYLESDSLDVYQPDVVLAVGMHRARMLAELCQDRNRWFTPHSWTNGLGVLANLHVSAGVGGGPYFEFPYDPPGWTPARRDFFLADPILLDTDGFLLVPDRPGLGATLNPEAVRDYRVQP